MQDQVVKIRSEQHSSMIVIVFNAFKGVGIKS
jgi:hypothetical protein